MLEELTEAFRLGVASNIVRLGGKELMLEAGLGEKLPDSGVLVIFGLVSAVRGLGRDFVSSTKLRRDDPNFDSDWLTL